MDDSKLYNQEFTQLGSLSCKRNKRNKDLAGSLNDNCNNLLILSFLNLIATKFYVYVTI